MRRVEAYLVDDLCGEKGGGVERHVLEIDGTKYEIDLNLENYQRLRIELEPYMQAGRRRPRSRARGSAPAGPSDGDARAARRWAKDNGVRVPSRGRLPRRVWEAFYASGM